MNSGQLPLFEAQPTPPPAVATAEAMAAGVRAPDNPYAATERRAAEIAERRGDDLGAEQTGLKDTDVPTETSTATESLDDESTKAARRLVELPGARGRVRRTNTPGIATPAEVQRGLTDEQIAARMLANTIGALGARNELRRF